jgi:hypothetical protein
MRAWTVRGGENGERELAALGEGLIILAGKNSARIFQMRPHLALCQPSCVSPIQMMGHEQSITGRISCGSFSR